MEDVYSSSKTGLIRAVASLFEVHSVLLCLGGVGDDVQLHHHQAMMSGGGLDHNHGPYYYWMSARGDDGLDDLANILLLPDDEMKLLIACQTVRPSLGLGSNLVWLVPGDGEAYYGVIN